MGDDIDKVLDAMASRPQGPTPKEPMTMKDFQKVLDSTPLFMRETPKGEEDNEVMDALQSLIFDGDGDGMFEYLTMLSRLSLQLILPRGGLELQKSWKRTLRSEIVSRCDYSIHSRTRC